MARHRRLCPGGTPRCPARRKCCPRTSTLSSTRRRRATARAFTVRSPLPALPDQHPNSPELLANNNLSHRAAQVDSCQPTCQPPRILNGFSHPLYMYYTSDIRLWPGTCRSENNIWTTGVLAFLDLQRGHFEEDGGLQCSIITPALRSGFQFKCIRQEVLIFVNPVVPSPGEQY